MEIMKYVDMWTRPTSHLTSAKAAGSKHSIAPPNSFRSVASWKLLVLLSISAFRGASCLLQSARACGYAIRDTYEVILQIVI